MTVAPIFDRLTLLLRDVFDNDELVATPELTAHDVAGRDSLGNVRLFIEVEREFSLRFSAIEIPALRNVGNLANIIERKLQRTPR